MTDSYFLDFFNKYIYKTEWDIYLDKEILIEDFKDFLNNCNLTDKIRILCFNKEKTLKDFLNLNEINESYCKRALTRLNKKTDIKITKKENGLNHYILTNKGLKNLINNTSSFFINNEYLKSFNKSNINNDNGILDQEEVLKGFKNFITEYHKIDLKKIINNGDSSLYIDYDSLLLYDYKLIDSLLDYPEQCIKIIQKSLNQLLDNETEQNINIRFSNLPKTQKVKIGGHRKKHINKLIYFEGMIRRKSDVKPRLDALYYLCTNPTCNYSQDKIKVSQFEEKAQILKTCPKCKSSVELIHKELEDSMVLILEETFSERSSDFDSKKIHVKIDSDLTDEINYNKLKISKLVKITGILKEVNQTTKGGSTSINYNYIFEANNIIFLEEEEDIILKKEDFENIKELSKQENILGIIKDSYLPDIYGYNEEKKALILQHIGSSMNNERNDSHILLFGDPGTAKSKMIIEHLKYSPRFVYSSGTSSTKAGMTACAIKDDLTGSFVLEPGVLPRANNGIAGTDELDKISQEDADCMTEALEQQHISVNKANISAQLSTKCCFIAGANPKYGKFEPELNINKQINFNPALISRFDLIFVIKDEPDEIIDTELVNHMFRSIKVKKSNNPKLSKEFIKKYLYYCRNNFNPSFTKEIEKKITKYYVEVRKNQNINNKIRFGARQFKGILRISSANAKLNQRNKIIYDDIKVAFDLYDYSMKSINNI